jgi:hypothetical protein
MRSLLHHARVGLAHAASRAPAHFRQMCFLLAAVLMAAQLAAPSIQILASATDHSAPAPALAASTGDAAGMPDIADLELTGMDSGMAWSTAISGTVAYLAETNHLFSLDVHNPAAPQQLGGYRFRPKGDTEFAQPRRTQVFGSHVFVTHNLDGLLIFDVSNPQQPTLCGTYTDVISLYDIDILGSLAYLSGDMFQIVDISAPCSPTLVYSSDLHPWKVAISGTRLYVGTAYDGVSILDVSDPTHPMLLGSYVPPIWPNTFLRLESLAIVGTRMYMGTEQNGLLIVDVSNPAAPTLLGRYQTRTSVMSVRVVGSRAYVGAGDLDIVDVGNPATPVLIGRYSSLLEIDDLRVVGSVAYLAASWADLQIVDISQPSAPKLAGAFITLKGASNIKVQGSLAYIGSNRFDIVDISTPNNPKIVSSYWPSGGAQNALDLVGSLAYLAGKNLEIVDVHDPLHPTLVGKYTPVDPGGWSVTVTQVQVVGTRAYVGIHGAEDAFNMLQHGWNGLLILDISNPAAPRLLSRYDTHSPVNDLRVVDARAYLAIGHPQGYFDGGMLVLNITNAALPTLIGSYEVPDHANAIQIVGNIAYLVEGYKGIDIIDISTPATPRRVGQYPHPLFNVPILALQVDGPIAYLMSSDIEILNVSDPSRPTLHSTYPTPGYVFDMQIVDDRIYVAEGAGLSILRTVPDQASAEVASIGGNLTNKINTMSMTVPPDSVDVTTVVSYTGFLAPTQPIGTDTGVVRSFEIDARRQGGAPMADFTRPYTIELRYNQLQLAAALAQESTLGVVAWDGDAWAELPAGSYSVDTANDRVTLTGTQAREYALVGRSAHTFLPLMSR